MDPGLISLGIGVASSGAQWWLQKKQVAEQKRVALEEERRTQLQRQAVLGGATARGAASGFEFESQGLQKYLGDMEAEFSRQRQWALDQARRGAKLGNLAAGIGLATGIAGSANDYMKSNNWFLTKALGSPA